jgi:hypothetical protein
MCRSFTHLGAALILLSFDPSYLTDTVKFIFSWVILLPIGVIISGKMLTQRLKLQVGTGHLIRISVPKVLTVQATGAEVILGFTWYIICLLLLGITFGTMMHTFVVAHFGIDPGQFNALGFMSSLFAASISFVIFLLGGLRVSPQQREGLEERNKKINRLTRERSGIEPTKLPEVKEP